MLEERNPQWELFVHIIDQTNEIPNAIIRGNAKISVKIAPVVRKKSQSVNIKKKKKKATIRKKIQPTLRTKRLISALIKKST
jgi:hypothetical protein